MQKERQAYAPRSAAAERPDWLGTARYEVVRCIGRGGMGAVYEARDHERQRRVALKTLIHFGPAALYFFKQEFRTLSDVQHPNLVRLYELVAPEGADRVFFSMELVRGIDFLTHVQGPDARAASVVDPQLVTAIRRTGDDWSGHEATHRAPFGASPEQPSPADFDRLRPALRQLVEGVQALHAAGKMHRDIKPSNILVTAEGRLVLLDFGVAIEVPRVNGHAVAEWQMVGTANYMAPEQALRDTPTPASDWYSVGVVLYEALVGRAPFNGPAFEVLSTKSTTDPPSVSRLVSGVPGDLEALCRALLDRVPEHRPTGPEILHLLGPERHSYQAPVSRPAPDGRVTGLAGRTAHLRALRDAFDAARAGHSITMRVRGHSGMGKSWLLQHFLDGLVEAEEATVLWGRAYERETVPYKAVDSIIDALTSFLIRLADKGDALAPPKDAWALARLFPVLRRVPTIGDLKEELIHDPQRVRQRAFASLRELLAELARRKPLVLFIDDAQWGDTDSAALLLELVRPPYTAPILLLMASRDDDDALGSAFLRQMQARWPAGAELRDLAVGPLETEDARRLALAILGSADASADRIGDAVARESGGSPFLVEELARSAISRPPVAGAGAPLIAVTLEEMVAQRIAALPGAARRLLEIVAIAGRPLSLLTVGEASGLRAGTAAAITLLREQRFVRPGMRDGHEVVDAIHDRIRETIVKRLSAAEVRDRHREIARVLETASELDAEALAMHWFGAGEKMRAAPYAECAAEQAAAQLAFDQAVRLLRLARDALPTSSPDQRRLATRLGQALEWAGLSEEAARVYVDAAEGAPTLERVALERAAAEQLLAAGRIDEGTRAIHRVLAEVGVRVPRSTLWALLLLLFYRVRVALANLRAEERDPDQVLPATRLRIDALYAAALGLAVVDLVTAAYMKARNLVEALRAGDCAQVSRAAVLLASDFACVGGPQGTREQEMMALAERFARRDESAEGLALYHSTNGACLMLRGRWRKALEECDSAYANYPNNRAGMQANGNLWAVYSLVYLGEFGELSPRLARLLGDAERRGDLYTSVNLRASHPTLAWLAADDPDTARRHVHEAMAEWSQSAFLVQHYQAMVAEAEIELYTGAGSRAYERVRRDARALKRSLMLNVQFIRGLYAFLVGRCALASLDAAPTERRRRLGEARQAANRLERERMQWTAPLATMLNACVAHATGDVAGAMGALRSAIDQAEAADMKSHAESARYRLGLLVGGEKGRSLVVRAEEAMAAREIRAPARFAAMLVPGFPATLAETEGVL